jgi:endonuclease I
MKSVGDFCFGQVSVKPKSFKLLAFGLLVFASFLSSVSQAALRDELRQEISHNRSLNYREAREFLFSRLDNHSGTVCSVYVKRCLRTVGIPDHRVMNTEHSWPQSRGATGIAKSDLHHLFPSDARVNSRRSSYPYCEVKNASWFERGSALGFSRLSGRLCFEPRDNVKGDVARALFYFAVRYDYSISEEQEYFLRLWHEADPVDELEKERNELIIEFQNNTNPFVDEPSLVSLINDF